MNLVEALQKANNESREHIRQLDEMADLVGNDSGLMVSKAITQALIDQTEMAIASGDVMQMISAAAAHGIGTEADDD